MSSHHCACGASISRRTKTGRCVRCAARDPSVIARKAVRTPEQIARRAELCRSLSADPVAVAKRTARMVETMKQPERKARHAEACREGKARELADPRAADRRREQGLALAARNAVAPDRSEVAYRALYADLRKARVPLTDRRRLIEEQIDADEKRRLAALSPFERQLERVAAGARVVRKVPMPSKAEPGFTLGGVATGLL